MVRRGHCKPGSHRLSSRGRDQEKTDNQIKKRADRANPQAENKPQEVQVLGKEIQELVTEITHSKTDSSRRNQLCSKRLSFCATDTSSGDFRRPKCHGQKNHAGLKSGFSRNRWTGDLASNDSAIRRVIKTRTVSLLKQITSPVEWNVEKSMDVLSSAITGWSSCQSTKLSVEKRSRTLSKSP